MKTHSKIVEYHLEASAFTWEISSGKSIEAWGFNKQVPGPELRANAGDTVIVKLTNNLNEQTTIHWHGIRLAAGMDGTVVPTRAAALGGGDRRLDGRHAGRGDVVGPTDGTRDSWRA